MMSLRNQTPIRILGILAGLLTLGLCLSFPQIHAGGDLYGDPLPEGAALRLGTVRQRAVGAKLTFSADGKTIIGVRGGKYVSIWDAETGKLKEQRELDGEVPFRSWLSPDGRWLAREHLPPDAKVTIWNIQTGKLAHTLTIKDGISLQPVAFSPDGTSANTSRTVLCQYIPNSHGLQYTEK